MIELKQGDLLSAEADALVNTVNCVGVMGKGIALQFRLKYPEVFKEYKRACKEGKVEPGRMLTVLSGQLTPRYIINFPTKSHWKERSKMEYIDRGLEALVQEVRDLSLVWWAASTNDIRCLSIKVLHARQPLDDIPLRL